MRAWGCMAGGAGAPGCLPGLPGEQPRAGSHVGPTGRRTRGPPAPRPPPAAAAAAEGGDGEAVDIGGRGDWAAALAAWAGVRPGEPLPLLHLPVVLKDQAKMTPTPSKRKRPAAAPAAAAAHSSEPQLEQQEQPEQPEQRMDVG